MTRKQAERQIDKTKEEISYGIIHWNELDSERQQYQSYLHHRIGYLEEIIKAYKQVDRAVADLERYEKG
jgi:hypothetical protein